jgi:chemotaxis family two-component system sensor kinase Cph1
MLNKNFDSTFCGSVPLHQINLIQPYGMLLVLEKGTYRILQVSENIFPLFDLQPSEIVNSRLDKYISVLPLDNRPPFKVPFTLSFSGKDYLAVVHEQNDSLLLELEEQTASTSFVNIYQQLKYAMEAINHAPDIEDACKVAADQLKALSGYDKVMVYRFDKDWNGTVIAEALVPGMESYMGLTFPASDIPRQARTMYLKNPYRMIPNREYVPVSLYPVINPVTNAFTDLSECNLRSVPAVHLEYMKNMNIMTSMSCRILKDGELWGLFSCHHRTAYYLPYEGRAVFELLSDIIASRIVSLHYKAASDVSIHLHSIYTHLVEQVYKDGLPGLLTGETNVLQLLDATGAILVFNRQLVTTGAVPGKHALKDLLLWLQDGVGKGVYQIPGLSDAYDPAGQYAAIASGVLVIPVQPEKGEFLLVFRPEVIREVNWGGNPEDAIRFEKDNIQYHPRNSFSIWQQKVQNTALQWKETEMSMAVHLRNFIIEYILKGLN